MLDNKPFKDIEKQVKHVVSTCSTRERSSRRLSRSEALRTDEPLPQTASSLAAAVPARRRVRTDQ